MKESQLKTFSQLLLAGLLVLSLTAIAAAQGRGRGGRGGGPPAGIGPGSGGGVDRGLGNASQRSNGRSDDGLGTASDRSGGRSNDGLNRARNGSGNNNGAPGSSELNRFRGIARKLDTTPEALQSQFLAARALNPDLNFGQFVAANVVADNLGATHSNITSSAILAGLQSGRSLGQTLQDLGLSKADAKAAKHQAEQQIKHSRQ